MDFSLQAGVDGTAAAADVVSALGVFENPEEIDINLMFAEQFNTDITVQQEIERICGTARKDCVGFISPDTTADTATEAIGDLSFNNSYLVMDSTAVYVYNKYNDEYMYIPASGHVAGLCARTDDTNDPWFSPAGYNRGNLLGVTKLKYNPKKADRDKLYKAGVNPIIAQPGQGILLFGDKTAQSKPSAFDRINVRRLFIVLEKAISTASKYQLFELNDEFTRAMFRNMTEPFLRDVKGRRGITDFMVVCDETNNNGEIIDTNRFVADIYVKPARSINFITLNFVATRTGVEFSEIVGTGN
jgi:phage tail sheath protein FI